MRGVIPGALAGLLMIVAAPAHSQDPPAAQTPEQPVLSSLSIEGASAYSPEELQRRHRLVEGQRLPASPESIAADIRKRYAADGSTFAEVKASLDAAGGLAIVIDEGQIDEIAFPGIDADVASRLRERFSIQPGDVFHRQQALRALENALAVTRGAIVGDRGRTFTSERLHEWKIGACPMSSMSIVTTPSVLRAWETDGQVYLADERSGAASAPEREGPALVRLRGQPRGLAQRHSAHRVPGDLLFVPHGRTAAKQIGDEHADRHSRAARRFHEAREPREVFGACGAACVIRRGLFDEIGGYADAMIAKRVLHAWKAGPQTIALRKQLEAMAPHCRWTRGRWDGLDLRWNELQNVPRHISDLSNYLIRCSTKDCRRPGAPSSGPTRPGSGRATSRPSSPRAST